MRKSVFFSNRIATMAVSMTTMLIPAGMLVTSCQSDDDSIVDKYNDVERDFTIVLNASAPGNTGNVSETRTNISDQHTFGLDISWTADDKIAVFGKNLPSVICLTSPVEIEGSDRVNGTDANDNASWADFTSQQNMTLANNVGGAPYQLSLVYPYDKVKNNASTANEVTLDFTGQDGTLRTLQDKYQYAYCDVSGIVSGDAQTATLSFTDNMGNKCNAEKSHQLEGYAPHTGLKGVMLDNKMSVIRFSLVYQKEDGTLQSFNQYLAENGKPGVTSITLADANGKLNNHAKLNLYGGNVTGSQAGSLTIANNGSSAVTLTEIRKDDPLSSGGQSWGSSFYASIPVPDKDEQYACNLDILVGDKHYVVSMNPRKFTEGRYYMTTPLLVTDPSKPADPNDPDFPLEIFTGYEDELVSEEDFENPSILVWDHYGAQVLWDRYEIYYVPFYFFENLKPGAIMTVDFRLGTEGSNLHFCNGRGSLAAGNSAWIELPIHPKDNPDFVSDGVISADHYRQMHYKETGEWDPDYYRNYTQVSIVLTQEIIDALVNNDIHGRGLIITGEGEKMQWVNRIVISNITPDQMPNDPVYGTLYESNDPNKGLVGWDKLFNFDDYCSRAFCTLREGDKIKVTYENNPYQYTDPTFLIMGSDSNYGLGSVTVPQHGNGSFEITVTDKMLYIAAYHSGIQFDVKESQMRITKIEVYR